MIGAVSTCTVGVLYNAELKGWLVFKLASYTNNMTVVPTSNKVIQLGQFLLGHSTHPSRDLKFDTRIDDSSPLVAL